MTAKYELTDERHPAAPDLRRIRALRDVRPGVTAGDLGGWVESEVNLSQFGTAWVSGDAWVFGTARVWASETCLTLTGLPSGNVTLTPDRDGNPLLHVGCWTGTPDALRTLIAGDEWPEARGDERDRRRPGLAALADMCDAQVALWGPMPEVSA